MKKSKLIIFDADDTLWRTQELYQEAKEAFTSILQDAGIHSSTDFLDDLDVARVAVVGFTAERFIDSMLLTYAIKCGEFGLSYNVEVERQIRGIYDIITSKPRLYPDTIEVLRALSTRYELVIYSGGAANLQIPKLQALGDDFLQYFQAVYLTTYKDESGILAILQERGYEPSNAWMVGNSIRGDVNPALRAGVNTIWLQTLSWKYDHEELYSEGYYTARSLTEAMKIILEKDGVTDAI